MMVPRITDYGAWHYCETCDNIILVGDWDSDARMCKACAAVIDEGGEDG